MNTLQKVKALVAATQKKKLRKQIIPPGMHMHIVCTEKKEKFKSMRIQRVSACTNINVQVHVALIYFSPMEKLNVLSAYCLDRMGAPVKLHVTFPTASDRY